MAGEIINLATFQLDTQKLQNSLSDLQDRYVDLRNEQKAFSNQSKETARQIDVLEKSQKALTAAAGDNSEAIEQNDKELQDLLKTQKELYKSEQAVGTQMSVVRKEINQTTTQLKAYQDAEGRTTSLINLGNQAIERQISNKNEAKAANIALNNVSNQLNPNIAEEAALLVRVNDQIDKNTAFIKENTSAVGQVKMSIGEYSNGIKDAFAQINPFNGGLSDFTARANEAGGAGNVLTGAFTAIRVGILGALKAGLAFIATPIGAVIAALAVSVGLVVGAFKLARAALTSTEEGTQKLAVITGAITGIFKGLFNVVKPLGLFFANVFIKQLELLGQVAEATLKGIASILEFVGAESAAKGIRNFTNEVKNSAVAAANLARAEGELTKRLRDTQNVREEYENKAEKLRQIRDASNSKSIAERIKANDDLGKVLKDQSALELSLAKQSLNVANLRIQAEGKTTEALDARQESLNKISEINNRITGQQSEQLANLNSLRKEAADLQKENDEKAIERALARSKAEIDLFIAQQGFKKKSMQEEVAFNEAILKKEEADLKLQLNNKKISQTEYEAQLLDIRMQALSKNTELVIENASLELDVQLEKNQRILENDKFLSDEQLRIKQEALDAQLLAELNYQALLLANGKINQEQFNAAINTINAENDQKNEELRIQKRTAEQERALIDLENQKIAQEENFLAQYEIETQQNEIRRQQEIYNAEQTGASITDINAKYAELNKQIEETKNKNKLQLASQTFGSLATIFGEESKAGKAAAIAQTTIDTYQAATAAYKSMAGIPIVGPALGGIAAAAAVASGIANVKKITATKQPSYKAPNYARGVIGLRGIGTGTSDDVNANLSVGESVITARATSMFPRELAAINQAGGGVGLNGTSNILDQNEITQSVKNSQMAQMIAEAVAIGAEAGTAKGSKQGIVDLSDNRNVMNNAKF